MRQLISRIDDRLHSKLKKRAAAERRSMNAIVTELLSNALAAEDDRARVLARLEALGLRVVPPRPKRRVRSRDAVIASLRGSGRSVSAALEEERSRR